MKEAGCGLCKLGVCAKRAPWGADTSGLMDMKNLWGRRRRWGRFQGNGPWYHNRGIKSTKESPYFQRWRNASLPSPAHIFLSLTLYSCNTVFFFFGALTPLTPQVRHLSSCPTSFLLLVILCVRDGLAKEAIGENQEMAGEEYSQQADGAPQGNHWDRITPSPPLPFDRRHPSSWSPLSQWRTESGFSLLKWVCDIITRPL